MTGDTAHRVEGTRVVPQSVLALSSLPRVDYADWFTRFGDTSTDASNDATPERWARAMFGDVPSFAERLIWRRILGFRLGRGPSPATVGGWQIADRGHDWIRLEAVSPVLTGNFIVQVAPGRVSWATLLQYQGRSARAAWPVLSVVHRRLVPGVLDGAAARLETT